MDGGADGVVVLAAPVFSDLGNLAFAVRREVFVIEQGVPPELEHDEDDLTATHLVALCEGMAAGTLRLLWRDEHVKIGRVAVRAAWRGKRVGAALMQAALAEAERRGQARCYLEAQADKTGFYERFGFFAYGDTFLDAGMVHRRMRNYSA